MYRLGWIFLLIVISACTPVSTGRRPEPIPVQAATAESTIAPTVTFTAQPEPTSTRLPPAATLPPTDIPPPGPVVCSPLEGIPISDLLLPDLYKNPFQLPRPGMDDGHHGIDLAYWSRGDRKTMQGHPIQSVLSGRVSGQVLNRDPYGYALIIETPLKNLPAAWMEMTALPTPGPTVQPAANLYCPAGGDLSGTGSGRSLYLLYAHMDKPPLVSIDEPVQCGQQIGEVGTTGNSVNLHLHLETRIGPTGVTFPDMAHYENDAAITEMQSYCAWRVSGLFQMFDPAILFDGQTLQP